MSEIKAVKAKSFKDWFKIYCLYQKAFPNGERKPFSIIWEMSNKGKTDVWYCEKDGVFAGLATTINSKEKVLLDYFAISKKFRAQGVGTAFLSEVVKKYQGQGIFCEIESTMDSEATDMENRLRRKRFYLAGGMEETGIEVYLFGVRMELLTYNCEIDFDSYKKFYKDSYGKGAEINVQKIK
jgi:GNAT superfamily N-acetyltransferase